MTASLARRIALWSLVAWAVSVLLAVIRSGGHRNIATFLAALLIAAATALVLSWLTSMVAGPFMLVKLRGRPDTLGVYRTIVLPLSLAVGLVCAIAVPVHWESQCDRHSAVVPLVTAPVYLIGQPQSARVAYIDFIAVPTCGR